MRVNKIKNRQIKELLKLVDFFNYELNYEINNQGEYTKIEEHKTRIKNIYDEICIIKNIK